MTTFIKRCRGEKKRRKKNRQIQKKLKIPDPEISECQNMKSNQKSEKYL